MKLNLLPTYVSKEKSAKAAWFFSAVITAAAIAGAVFMRVTSQAELDEIKKEAESVRPQAERALAISREADEIMRQAGQIIVNIDLAQAMIRHSAVYPDLYDEIKGYIPSFFRVTGMSAAPTGPTQCVVSLSGVLRTHQEYADLMLALLRIPGAQSVSRDGYQITDPYVPPLNEADQTGRPIRPGEQNIPDDPMQRLDYFLSQASPQGFLGVGGFGTDDIGPRGAMPEWSEVTVTVLLDNRNIQAPDHRATLAAARSSAPSPAGGVARSNLPRPGG